MQFHGSIGKDGIWMRDSMMNCGIDVGGIIISDVRLASLFADNVYWSDDL